MMCRAGLSGRRKQPLFEKSGAKTFGYARPKALSPPKPMTQPSKVFLLLFVHKKKSSFSLACSRPLGT
jgi:hypothetical protein